MNSNSSTKKILMLSANPKGTNKLRLDEEARDIKEGLKQARERDQFTIDSEWAIRPRDVRRAILFSNPQIVHFSGHGSEDGGLAFEDETGQVQLVQPEALAGLFELLANDVECVILNACYSEIQASAIAKHIDYVIGMSKEIGDKAAIEFSVGFYDALGAGYSIENAYGFGCNAIKMAGIQESTTPVLKRKDNSSSSYNPKSSSDLSVTVKGSVTRSLRAETKSSVMYSFVLTGSVDEVSKEKLEAIVAHLQGITGDASITLRKVKPGSIKLILEGSPEGFEKIKSLIESGQLKEIMGLAVQDVQLEQNLVSPPYSDFIKYNPLDFGLENWSNSGNSKASDNPSDFGLEDWSNPGNNKALYNPLDFGLENWSNPDDNKASDNKHDPDDSNHAHIYTFVVILVSSLSSAFIGLILVMLESPNFFLKSLFGFIEPLFILSDHPAECFSIGAGIGLIIFMLIKQLAKSSRIVLTSTVIAFFALFFIRPELDPWPRYV
jgi:hypothetical protein